MKNKYEFPCVLCAVPLPVRWDKNQKPYLVCDPCGMQLFIRRAEGRGRLEALIARWNRAPESLKERSPSLLLIRNLLAEIEELSTAIENFETRRGLWATGSDLQRRIAALKRRKESALAELESLCPTSPADGRR